MTVHEFNESYKEGKKGEAFLDDFFRRTYPDTFISGVDRDHERRGIDRIFDNGTKQFKVEYKTDYMTAKTGNIFLELSVNHYPKTKQGWTTGSQADILVYYIPDVAVYMLSFSLLRKKLDDYYMTLQRKVVWNKGFDGNNFSTYGLLLPVRQFEKDFRLKTWRI